MNLAPPGRRLATRPRQATTPSFSSSSVVSTSWRWVRRVDGPRAGRRSRGRRSSPTRPSATSTARPRKMGARTAVDELPAWPAHDSLIGVWSNPDLHDGSHARSLLIWRAPRTIRRLRTNSTSAGRLKPPSTQPTKARCTTCRSTPSAAGLSPSPAISAAKRRAALLQASNGGQLPQR